MTVIEKLLAALVLIVCVVMLVRMVLPARHQQRLDARLRAGRDALRGLRLKSWRRSAARQDAARTAEEVIRKARGSASRRPNGRAADPPEPEGEWDGNVFRPKSFKPPQKPH